MKIRRVFAVVLMANFTLSLKAQNSNIINLIEKLPEIEYGELPYWHGNINKNYVFEHGFNYTDSMNNLYNKMVYKSLSDSSMCFVIKNSQKVPCFKSDILFEDRIGCSNSSYKTEQGNIISNLFCPSVYATAKSIVYEKYYVVYFWRALFSESIFYYSLVFDFGGNLLSFQNLDYWNAGFPYFPFNNPQNKVREVDYDKIISSYLPNKLLLLKQEFKLEGGGKYSLVRLTNDGHYDLLRSWTEIGEIDKELTKNDKYINLILINEEGKKTISLKPFSVKDPDGFSNIRINDNSSSSIVRTVKNGDIVFGTYLQNGWCKIDFTADANGTIQDGGFIHVSRLVPLAEIWGEFINQPSETEWKDKIIK